MATTVRFSIQLQEGRSSQDGGEYKSADFVPNVGDLFEKDGERYVVRERLFRYSMDGTHAVLVTVIPGK